MTLRYVARRLGQGAVALAGVVVITFLLLQYVPGDPTYTLAGPDAGEEDLVRVRKEYGLDRPAIAQFTTYANRLLHGNLGESYDRGAPVLDVIRDHVRPTLLLTGTALLVSTAGGIALGLLSARRAHTWLDNSISAVTLVMYAVPGFWLAQLAIIYLVFRFDLFPLSGYSQIGRQAPTGLRHLLDVGHHLALPVLVLAAAEVAAISRLARAGLLTELGQSYMRTALAKGVSTTDAVSTHAQRNALLPMITLIGTRVGFLFSGAVVIESAFAWPGIGSLLRNAASSGDRPLLLGLVIVVSTAVIVASLITDLAYTWVDPRIRYD